MRMGFVSAPLSRFAILYFAAVLFGMNLAAGDRFAVMCPSVAVLLAGLLASPPRHWRGLLTATVPVQVIAAIATDVRGWQAAWELGYSWLLTVCVAVIVQRYAGALPFGTLTYALVFAGMGVLLVSAIIALLEPGTILALMSAGATAEFRVLWSAAWLSAATGFVVLTPAVSLWLLSGRPRSLSPVPGRSIEKALLWLCVVAAFGIAMVYGAKMASLHAVVLVPILWAAARFGFATASSVVFAVIASAAFLGAQGLGSFAQLLSHNDVMSLQLHMLLVLTPTLMLAVSVDDRHRAAESMAQDAAALRQGRERLTVALKAARTQKPTGEIAARLIADEMNAAVTHQINQPLGAILNNAEAGIVVLQSGAPSMEDIESILIDVRDDALRASEISRRMRALLQFQELRREDLDLNRSIHFVIDLLADQTALRGVVMEARLGAEARVHADPVHLEQVLLNLLINAMDAMANTPQEMRRIVVQTMTTDRHTVEVSVSDTGGGIAADKLTEIFEPFHTTKSRGMGVGLSIVRFIIRAHGGDISAANNESGPGAVFRFELPSVPARGADARSTGSGAVVSSAR